jgi:hypothetical protein
MQIFAFVIDVYTLRAPTSRSQCFSVVFCLYHIPYCILRDQCLFLRGSAPTIGLLQLCASKYIFAKSLGNPSSLYA